MNTFYPEKMGWVRKESSIVSSNYFDQKQIISFGFLSFRLKIDYFEQGTMIFS